MKERIEDTGENLDPVAKLLGGKRERKPLGEWQSHHAPAMDKLLRHEDKRMSLDEAQEDALGVKKVYSEIKRASSDPFHGIEAVVSDGEMYEQASGIQDELKEGKKKAQEKRTAKEAYDQRVIELEDENKQLKARIQELEEIQNVRQGLEQ